MFRKLLSVVIACLMLQPAHAGAENKIRDRIRALPPGCPLELKLTNGEKLKGRLGSVGQESLELRISGKGTITARTVALTEVQSMRVRRGMSTGAKIGLGLGIFAGVAVLVTALVLRAIGRNG